MADRPANSDPLSILSLNQTPAARYAANALSVAPPYLPYSSAWQEFKMLEKANRGQRVNLLHMMTTILTGFGTLFGFHYEKSSRVEFLIGFLALLAFTYFHWRKSRDRFLHWPCPRCGAEWPGDKTQKDSKCKICGLRLYQESP
ncbi:MAG TPA: hypothetical protein VJR23_10300 [Candidatus Acidoferrales bacterium]|nr:hypothetical protein [Candidatus Acidoferrales bacterium]